MGFALVFGVFPFLALPVVAVVALLIWPAPWAYRALSFVVLALLMVLVAVIVATNAIAEPWLWFAAPMSWLGPLAGWGVFTRVLQRSLSSAR